MSGLARGTSRSEWPHRIWLLTVGALVSCMFAVWPAPATADFGPPKGVYGGEAAVPGGRQSHYPFSAEVSSSGRQVTMLLSVWTRSCRAPGEPWSRTASFRAPIRRDGTFAGAGVISEPYAGGGSFEHDYVLRGRITADRIVGTYRETQRQLDESGSVVDVCVTGTLRWEGARDPGQSYGGVSVDPANFFDPFSMLLNRTRDKVRDFRLFWVADCGEHSGQARTLTHVGIPLRRGSRIARSGSFSYSVFRSTGQETVQGRFTLQGTVGRRSAAGTYRAQMTVSPVDGSGSHECDTGRVRWEASSR